MKYPGINPGLFIKNREKLISRLDKNSIAIIHANYEMPRSGDQYFPYRQNSDLFYLTGINQEKTILVLCPGHYDKELREILFILKSDKKLEIWEGKKLTRDKAGEISGINTVRWADEFDNVLHSLMPAISNVYINISEYPKFNPEVKQKSLRFANELKKKFPLHCYKRLTPGLTELRLVKEKEEIDLIKTACGITKEAFIRALKYVRPGVMEYEIEAEISHEYIRRGATDHAFRPIVASGNNACVLHYIDNNKECRNGDLLLMDFGAEYANYASDCSRTVPINGKFTGRQKELYDATLKVFKFARSLMKPGTTINKLHRRVCECWEEEHIKLKLYTKDEVKNEDKKEPFWSKYYLHGTSHFMGLDVHDVGSKDVELKPGMVLTCEPGIYIFEENTGIRLENDILITEKGNVDLMEDIPIEAQEIEEIMNSKR